MRKAIVLIGIAATALGQPSTDFFEKKIRPVLATSCQGCHNAKVKSAGLDLSTAAGFLAGGQSGPLINKDQPEKSRLLEVVSYDERLKMPPTGKLPATQLADLAEWVKSGAAWPGASAAQSSGAVTVRKGGRNFSPAEKAWWAFQPIASPNPPAVKSASPRTAIDRFLVAKLQDKGLQPAAPADKATLLRRATFDLHGLPPAPKEIADFLADSSPDAFRKVVDRLLESPRYGERWGRHWLDMARYADSTGNDEDHRYPYAWRYRDYVIDAFNRDMPFDQLIREQIAGDLLPSSGGINRQGIIATGFLALGAKAIAQQDKKKMLYDVYDEQVDVVSKAFLGLTTSCARCHDHKFDPILTRDYYAMINFFANTKSFQDPELHVSKLLYTPLVPKSEYAVYKAHQDKLTAAKLEQEDIVEEEKERYNKTLTPKLAAYMMATRAVAAGKSEADAAAAAQLDPALLKKWVAYLKTDPRKKPHFEPWSTATDATAAEVAAKYQAGYEKTMAKWSEKIARWRETTRRMLTEMNMPPPPKPTFSAEEDGFFYDVYIQGGPFVLRERDAEKILSTEAKAKLEQAKARMAELKKSAPPEPDLACAVQEEEKPVRQHVFIRGDYASLGEEAPKGFPLILAKATDPNPGKSGSGRLALAEWIASKDNPLTARVMANRIWHWHFGEGLVRTPDNFGRMGEKPSHPELLDYLASEFLRSGWSIKSMHRLIMNSAAYQMSSTPSAAALEKDVDNRLLSRFHRRRLTVEEIRDGLLLIDGKLDLAMGGTMQSGFGTDGENNQGRLSINPDKQVRRTVYLPLRRANLPAVLNLFDFGDATTVQGRRIVTNVASQALFMLNSEFVSERSTNLAKSILARDGADQQRIEAAYLSVLNRKPESEEADAGLTYIAGFQKRFDSPAVRELAWASMCRALMASNGFIYVD